MRLVSLVSLSVVLVACSATRPPAAPGTCRRSPEPVEPIPAPSPDDDVVFHEEQFDVVGPRAAFVRAFLAAPLERFIRPIGALPGVHHTEPLTASHYPEVGSVRLVCVTDAIQDFAAQEAAR